MVVVGGNGREGGACRCTETPGTTLFLPQHQASTCADSKPIPSCLAYLGPTHPTSPSPEPESSDWRGEVLAGKGRQTDGQRK